MPTDDLGPEDTSDIEALLLQNLPAIRDALGLPHDDGTFKRPDPVSATLAPPVDRPFPGHRQVSNIQHLIHQAIYVLILALLLLVPTTYYWLSGYGPTYPDEREAFDDGEESLRIPLLLKHDLVEVTSYYHDGVAESLEFGGYPCTDDCSGHIAGYDWAEEQGITDPAECTGDSDSLMEGCLAWTEEPDQRP